ncbi:MAG: carboxypeptidase-like regulatory domain-containing protein, partial [Muribaculaceae bacterium]|nr:carboxypeptidase-like regulatory domain-containing protein [Muribaculaceae bacterium]
VVTSAQNITISVTHAPADSIFNEIMRMSGKNFIYKPQLLADKRFSVNAVNKPVGEIISELFRNTNVDYKIKGDNIILFERKRGNETVTISGFVHEGLNGESLIGAVVYDINSKRGTQTNVSGFYTLTIPEGEVRLRVSYPGFTSTESAPMKLSENRTMDFTLNEVKTIAEVEVIGDKNRTLALESAETGRLNLSNAAIISTPTMFGESDVIKTLQLQPGVSAGIEGFAGMYVHGGNNDENLYMLNNVPLYQINHFAGLFSAFNTAAIKNVDFYKTSFPAKYDGRLSSIMEVNTLDGSTTNHNGSLTVGLTSAAFYINGPIKKNSTAYSVALRRSWYDILTVPAL